MTKAGWWEQVMSWFRAAWAAELAEEDMPRQPESSVSMVLRELHRMRAESRNDRRLDDEQLARAAVVYISPDRVVVEHTGMSPWPWPERLDECDRLSPVERMIRGLAYGLRELERLRGEAKVSEPEFIDAEPVDVPSPVPGNERATRPVPKPPTFVGPSYDDGTEWDDEKKWGGERVDEPRKP